jgi:hypothetical protein
MDPFERLLREYRGSGILLVYPGGDFGDELILMGIQKQLGKLQISHKVLKIDSPISPLRSAWTRMQRVYPNLQIVLLNARPELLENALRLGRSRAVRSTIRVDQDFGAIVFNGGGYLNDIWNNYGALSAMKPVFRKSPHAPIIVGPQSYFFKDSTHLSRVLADIEQEVYLFCREATSYALLDSIGLPSSVHTYLSNDAALYLTEKDISVDVCDRFVLVAPRLDRESAVKWKIGDIMGLWPGDNLRFGDLNLLPDFGSYVRAVASSSKVYTDRLHVAILATILDKETYLLPNSYHKNKSTYEFSLKGFESIEFLDCKEFPTPDMKG